MGVGSLRPSPLGLYPEKAVVLDPVHGAIQVTTAEFALIQAPELRRLHNIKQLGLVHLVYPQATHSRFSHSLGVMRLAGLTAQRVLASTPERVAYEHLLSSDRGAEALVTLARLAGLLHDIGHMPFSHALESGVSWLIQWVDALERGEQVDPHLADVAETVRRGAEELRIRVGGMKPHEYLSKLLILNLARNAETGAEPHLAEFAASEAGSELLPGLLRLSASALFSRGKCDCDQPELDELGLRAGALCLIRVIISNEVADADRLDYLIRDSHNTGVVFGNIDYERLLSNVSYDFRDGTHCLILKDKAIPTLDDVFDARLKMYRSVYLHHKSIALNLALARALIEIIKWWDEVALPEYRECGVGILFNPDSMAECISNRVVAFDDYEFETMIRRASAKGGRWSRSLTYERPLLPVSLVKRPEALALRVLAPVLDRKPRALGDYVRIRQITRIVEYSIVLLHSLQSPHERRKVGEDIRNRIAVILGVPKDSIGVAIHVDTIADSRLLDTGGPLCPEAGSNVLASIYLRLVAEAALTPLVYAYAFSDDVKVHKLIYRERARLRAEAENILVEYIQSQLGSG